jgi:O-antigen ligase
MCLSVLWSDHSFVALKRIIKDFGNVIMILLIVTEEDPVEAVRQVLLRCAYVLIPLSVLAVKYYLDVGRYYNQWTWRAYFCGITTDKNALGRLAMLSIFAVLWTMSEERKGSNLISLVKRKWPEIIILCMCLWIWKEADSATAIGCGVLGLGILFSSNSSWVRRNPRLLGTAAFGFIAISLLFLCIPDLRAIVTSSLGRNVNLTERTDIWEGAMRLGTNPLVGEGFDSVWLTDKGRALLNSLQAAHGHNGFLETYLNGGLIGLGLLLAMLFRGGQDIVRKLATGSPIGPFFAALFCTCFIYNYTEAALNNNNSAGFTLFLSAFGYPFAARHFADCEINAPIESDTQNSHEVIG